MSYEHELWFFRYMVLIIHDIGSWYYNNAYLQVKDFHGKMGQMARIKNPMTCVFKCLYV